jgi:acetyl esterase/lipase
MTITRYAAGMAATLALALAAQAAAQAPAPAPESYTAQTTYQKLVKAYPFIRIASSEVPQSVRALTGITYVRRGGHALQLDLYLPAHPATSQVPGIVFVHGGGWRAGVRANFAPMAIRMAERGYAAATISYRLSPEALYPAAVQDARAAVRWMRTHAGEHGIDPARIAIGGGSAGGQIAALAGVTDGLARFDAENRPDDGRDVVSSAVQAIVNIDGLSDFTSEAARKYEDDPARQPSSAGAWFGGRYAEKADLWREASPLLYVNPKTPPILFVGSGQARFSLGREEMVAKMRVAGVASQVVLLPDTPHSFWLFDPWLEPAVEATVAFLKEYLR